MRFRSLFIDYKAEALQILREEKEDKAKNKQKQQRREGDEFETEPKTCADEEDYSFCGQRRRRQRVIRILLDSKDEHYVGNLEKSRNIESESATRNPSCTTYNTSSNQHHQKLPFWLSPSVSNFGENDVVVKTVVVTPMSKITNNGIFANDIEDIPMGNSVINDCEEREAILARGTKTTIDYKIFYESPLLLFLVSSIRRRANRKRIANQSRSVIFQFRYNTKISYHRRCPNDSFSCLYRTIIQRAIHRCWIRNSWKAGWKRMEELFRIDDCHRALFYCGIQKGYTGMNRSSKTAGRSSLSLSSVIHDRNGDFTSLSIYMCSTLRFQQNRHRQLDSFVIFRGGSTDIGLESGEGDDKTHQQRLVLAKTKKNCPLSSSRKLWETAILTAAVLCAHQKHQQQKNETSQKDEYNHSLTLRSIHPKLDNREELLRSPSFLPMRERWTSPNQGYKNDSPNSGEENDFTKIFEHQKHHQQQHLEHTQQQQEQFYSRKLEVLKSHHPRLENSVAKNERKRSPSPLRQEKATLLSPTRKRPREEEQSKKEFVQDANTAKGFEMSHHIDPLPSSPANPSSSKQKQQSSNQNPKDGQVEKCRRKELFLLQRFGLLSSKKKNQNDTKLSITSTEHCLCMSGIDDQKTQGHKDDAIVDSSMSQDIQDNEMGDANDSFRNSNGDCHEFLSGVTNSERSVAVHNVDYSSPIEFPVCLDYYEEEEEDEEKVEIVNGNISTPFAEEIESHAFSIMSSTSPTIQFPVCLDYYEEEEEEEEDFDGTISAPFVEQIEPCTFPVMSTTHPTTQSSKKAKKERRKRPRRTSEEKILRKKQKRRRREKKKKNCRNQIGREPDYGVDDDHNDQGEGDKLETPRKLDIKDFSPVKALGNGSGYKSVMDLLNLGQLSFHGPNADRKMPINDCVWNDQVSKSTLLEADDSIPCTEDGIASDDPFSVSPDEILQTLTYPGPLGDEQQQQLQAKKEAPICLLCSEAFIENFGDVVAEIVRDDSLVSSSNSESPVTTRRPIRFTDTDLVDLCSVDIELFSRGAVVVSTLSQIQNFGGLMAVFLPRIVELAASNRYDHLVVFVCVDLELDSAASRALARLQTAFLSCDKGLPRTQTSIQLCSKRSLGACISRNIVRSAGCSRSHLLCDSVSKVDHWLSDLRTCQRLKFLLSIIPTLSATAVLHWLDLSIGVQESSRSMSLISTEQQQQHIDQEEDKSSAWFQRCFRDGAVESNMLESHMLRSNESDFGSNNTELRNFMNPNVPKQLVRLTSACLNQV